MTSRSSHTLINPASQNLRGRGSSCILVEGKEPKPEALIPAFPTSSTTAAHLRGGQARPPSPLPSSAGTRSGYSAVAGTALVLLRRRALEPVRADYLFRHDQGCDKKIGIDSYGIPIYANKSQGSRSISVAGGAVTGSKIGFFFFYMMSMARKLMRGGRRAMVM